MKTDFECLSLKGLSLRKRVNADAIVNGYRYTDSRYGGIYYFAVADGMGDSGKFASNFVVNNIKKEIDVREQIPEIKEADQFVDFIVGMINSTKDKLQEEASKRGPLAGTTLDLLLLDFRYEKPVGVSAHFGDGRIYMHKDENLKLLTTDDARHTTEDGNCLDDDRRFNCQGYGPNYYFGYNFPKNLNLIRNGQSCIRFFPLSAGQTFLVCTDGLIDCVSDKELRQILSGENAAEIAFELYKKYLQPQEMVPVYREARNISDYETAFKKLRARDNASFYVIKIKENDS